MNNKIVKLIAAGAAIGAAAFVGAKVINNSDKIDEKIKNTKSNIKNFDDIKEICNKKLSGISDKNYNKKLNEKYGKLNDLKRSFFNKQSSRSVVFGNPTYNLYGSERSDKDE